MLSLSGMARKNKIDVNVLNVKGGWGILRGAEEETEKVTHTQRHTKQGNRSGNDFGDPDN